MIEFFFKWVKIHVPILGLNLTGQVIYHCKMFFHEKHNLREHNFKQQFVWDSVRDHCQRNIFRRNIPHPNKGYPNVQTDLDSNF